MDSSIKKLAKFGNLDLSQIVDVRELFKRSKVIVRDFRDEHTRCVVHQNVDISEFVNDLLEGGLRSGIIRNIVSTNL